MIYGKNQSKKNKSKISQIKTKKMYKMWQIHVGDFMFKLDFSKQEIDNIKSKVYLSELQERILEYRLREYSITKMAMLENCSESTVNREIKKLKKKIMKTL